MPTTETWTVKASDGDYTTLAAAVAAKVTSRNLVTDDVIVVIEVYENLIETVTVGTGSTMDATRFVKIVGGLNGAGDSFKHKGKILGAKATIYGAIAAANTTVFMTVEDLTFVAADGAFNGAIDLNNNVTAIYNRCIFIAADGRTARSASATCTATFNSCIFIGSDSGLPVIETDFSTSTFNLNNCTIVADGASRGVEARGSSTINALNCWVFGDTVTHDYLNLTTKTTCASTDATGSVGLQSITEAQFAHRIAGLSSLRAYGTFEDEPTAAPGKHARAALYRSNGALLGSLGGDAAIASGTITGTTGGITYAEATLDSVDSIAFQIKATMPAAPTSRGFLEFKPSASLENAIYFGIGVSGNLYVTVFNSSGVFDHVLTYTPVGDNLAGENVYGFRVSGGTTYLYLNGTQVNSVANPVTRSSSDDVQYSIACDASNYLGSGGSATSWGFFNGASAPPTIPLSLYDDEAGALDDYILTPETISTFKTSGTGTGAPDLDIRSREYVNNSGGSSIGCFSFEGLINEPGNGNGGIPGFGDEDSRNSYGLGIVGSGVIKVFKP